MKATIKWVDGVQFLAESGSGHAVLVEGPESEGGRNIGCRPMELMLMGLGVCTSYDVINILGKPGSPSGIVWRRFPRRGQTMCPMCLLEFTCILP